MAKKRKKEKGEPAKEAPGRQTRACVEIVETMRADGTNKVELRMHSTRPFNMSRPEIPHKAVLGMVENYFLKNCADLHGLVVMEEEKDYFGHPFSLPEEADNRKPCSISIILHETGKQDGSITAPLLFDPEIFDVVVASMRSNLEGIAPPEEVETHPWCGELTLLGPRRTREMLGKTPNEGGEYSNGDEDSEDDS